MKTFLENHLLTTLLLGLGIALLFYGLIAGSELTWWLLGGAVFIAGGLYGFYRHHRRLSPQVTQLESAQQSLEKPSVILPTTVDALSQTKIGDIPDGVITGENGSAFYGNSKKYSRDLYYGRVSKDAELRLMDPKVYKNDFDIPIIKVKVLKNKWQNEVGKIGWVDLTETSFSEFYDSHTKYVTLEQALQRPTETPKLTSTNHTVTTADYLQNFTKATETYTAAYLDLVALGGEAVGPLSEIANDKSDSMQPVAIQMLNDIADRTQQDLGDQLDQLICERCFTNFDNHTLKLAGQRSIRYCGCRQCHQSRAMFEVTGDVVAILDNRYGDKKKPYSRRDNELHVNWLALDNQLFDFNAIRIYQATDEQIERFVIQIRNDTDPWRKSRYKTMTCTVSKRCKVSQNTQRVLESTFQLVEMK